MGLSNYKVALDHIVTGQKITVTIPARNYTEAKAVHYVCGKIVFLSLYGRLITRCR